MLTMYILIKYETIVIASVLLLLYSIVVPCNDIQMYMRM